MSNKVKVEFLAKCGQLLNKFLFGQSRCNLPLDSAWSVHDLLMNIERATPSVLKESIVGIDLIHAATVDGCVLLSIPVRCSLRCCSALASRSTRRVGVLVC